MPRWQQWQILGWGLALVLVSGNLWMRGERMLPQPVIAPSGVAVPTPSAINSTWVIETVDSLGQVGESNDLVLDPIGQPHISYYDRNEGALKYATCISANHADAVDGCIWHIEVVDYNAGLNTSIVLDRADRPRISYRGEEGLLYAYFDGTEWITETVCLGQCAFCASLALDAADQPHISSLFPFSHQAYYLQYSYHDGTNWSTQMLDFAFAGELASPTSLALDSTGQPHIGYALRGMVIQIYYVNYAHYDGQGWHTETVDRGGWVSLALDSLENPYLAYNRGGGTLGYASYDGSIWITETMSVGSLGYEPSLALDNSNRPHISYYNYDKQDLYYAYYNEATGWVTETVDSLGDVGRYNSLALDALGLPHISYYDYSNGALKYAYKPCLPVASVQISGPGSLLPEMAGHYQVVYTPPTATLPLSVTWDTGALGPSAVYSWTAVGTYTVVLTATNRCGGTQSASLPVRVLEGWPYKIYLPLVLRPQ